MHPDFEQMHALCIAHPHPGLSGPEVCLFQLTSYPPSYALAMEKFSLLVFTQLRGGTFHESQEGRAHPPVNAYTSMKRSGPALQLMGIAPLWCQGQNLFLAMNWVVSSQDLYYRAMTIGGNKRHYHSCSWGGKRSFSLELVSGWVFRVFSTRE